MKKLYLIIAICATFTHKNYSSQIKSSERTQEITINIDPRLDAKLFKAIEDNDVKRVQNLLSPKKPWYLGSGFKSIPDVNARNQWGITPLIFAIAPTWYFIPSLRHSPYKKKDIEIVKLLLQAQADPDIQRNGDGSTALLYATYVDDIETIKLLLEAHANPDIPNASGDTSLIIASMKGKPDIVKLLLEVHANPNLVDYMGNTALNAAAEEIDIKIIKMLLHAGAKPTENFWRAAEAVPAVMNTVKEYNTAIEQEKQAITTGATEAIFTESFVEPGITKIIREYVTTNVPAQREIESKEEKEKKSNAAVK